MNRSIKWRRVFISCLSAAVMTLTSCNLPSDQPSLSGSTPTPAKIESGNALEASSDVTPLPTRPSYSPGQLVDYTAQTGDTLPALANRFNTTIDQILAANTFIPRDATTMPQGMPMRIPIYYRALWGTSFQIIPDHEFVDSPTSIGFSTSAFVADKPGWLKNYRAYVGSGWKSGAELVDYVAINYSINPRLLLAILEYQGGALTQTSPPVQKNILGLHRPFWETPYLQMVLAANILNNGYYGWLKGNLIEFEDQSSILIRPDPWQNAGTVGLEYYFAQIFSGDDYARAVGPDGLYKTFLGLFGDPWENKFDLIPGSLQQPQLALPFPSHQTWSFTGGPHTGWGTGEPFAALDFAPPLEKAGCNPAKPENFATAVADGLVVRSSIDGLALDLDKDGDERTGWVIFYLHLATQGRAPLGTDLKTGDMIGYPSCEGGRSTGTHVHIARKYNGEWIPADSAIPFNVNGWIAHDGGEAYLGTLTKGGLVIKACVCGDQYTAINGSYP